MDRLTLDTNTACVLKKQRLGLIICKDKTGDWLKVKWILEFQNQNDGHLRWIDTNFS